MKRKTSQARHDAAVVPVDSSDASGVDWVKAERVLLPNLKPTTTTISLRLPDSLLTRIKIEANRRDVPYQSYMKMLLAEAMEDA